MRVSVELPRIPMAAHGHGEGCVRQRDLFCWIKFDRTVVGALHFIEFDADALITAEEFFDTMDADAQADATLAEVLCGAWDDVVSDVLERGPVLDFRLAWMSPKHARAALWANAADALIDAEFGDHSILVMKAFPLEYEGRAPEGSAAHSGLIRRQAAMIRHYCRLFGVSRFPSWAGNDGWLWRQNPKLGGKIVAPLVMV